LGFGDFGGPVKFWVGIWGLGILVATGCRGMVGEVVHPAVVVDCGRASKAAGALTSDHCSGDG